MSFISTFEELSKLYESVEPEVKEVPADETETVEEGLVGNAIGSFVGTAAANVLTEDDEEPEVDGEEDEEEEEPVSAEEPRQVVLECSNCGGLLIKEETAVVVNEDSDLANVEETCQYCEEAAGYKILGVVAPYEAEVVDEAAEEEAAEAEVVEEGLVDLDLPIDVDIQANGNDVSVGSLG